MTSGMPSPDHRDREVFFAQISRCMDGLYRYARQLLDYYEALEDLPPDQIKVNDVVDTAMVRAWREFGKQGGVARNLGRWWMRHARCYVQEEVGRMIGRSELMTSKEDDLPENLPEEVSWPGEEIFAFFEPEQEVETVERQQWIAPAMAGTPAEWRRTFPRFTGDLEGNDREGTLLDQAFTRAGGAPPIRGNGARVLRNAAENYPAWLNAIREAREKIYFENYFICEDEVGEEFADALAERARAGVCVRLIHDWFGAFHRASRPFWRRLSAAGVEVRSFNPPRLQSSLDLLQRDHRKMVAVDGSVGFITGLCVGQEWVGDPGRDRDPWRDTGIEVRGPALHDIERAFAQIWATTGPPVPDGEIRERDAIGETGDVTLRVVPSLPGTSGLFRLDQLMAAAARRTLWLTDAYFAGVSPYVQALRSAARDGVDVRLLVPGTSDVRILQSFTRAGYRPLLEAGVRVFEWNGSMLHAKTAVADGRWARVGSSNLNVASWLNNCELDAVVEHEGFAAAMEDMYLEDLEFSTEIVLAPGSAAGRPARRRGGSAAAARRTTREAPGMHASGGSASRAAAGALRLGRTVGAALTGQAAPTRQRVLEPTEAPLIAPIAAVLLTIAIVGILWPIVLALPLALLLLCAGVALLARAYAMRRERQSRGVPRTRIRARGDSGAAAPSGHETHSRRVSGR